MPEVMVGGAITTGFLLVSSLLFLTGYNSPPLSLYIFFAISAILLAVVSVFSVRATAARKDEEQVSEQVETPMSPWSTVMTVCFYTLSVFTVVSLVILAVFKLQSKFIYHPLQFGDALSAETPHEDVWLTSPDGTRINLLYVPPSEPTDPDAKEVIHAIVFHSGTSGYAKVEIAEMRSALVKRGLRVAFMAPSYRGYGRSGGHPGERGIQSDVQTAFDWYLRRLDADYGPGSYKVIVYGISLGGAVTIDLVSKNSPKISGMIVENTFTTMHNLIQSLVHPVTRHVPWFFTEKYASIDKIANILKGVRVMVITGMKDALINPSHSFKLVERFKDNGNQTEHVQFPEGTHNYCRFQPGYFNHFAKFIWSLP